MTENSQHGFTYGKSRLTNLIVVCDKIIGFVDETRAVDVTYLDFSEAFETAAHSILVSQVRTLQSGWVDNKMSKKWFDNQA